jgi:hypothetical protein
MTGKLIWILVCLAFGLTATAASAQTRLYGIEYGLLSLPDKQIRAAISFSIDQADRETTLMRAIEKTFVFTERAGRLRREAPGYYFREPDPELWLPQAFRRPKQMRLGFRIRF